MAFRVPPQAPRRQTSYSTSLQAPALEIPLAPSQQQDDESREWILFSPSQAPSTTRTHSDSTECTPRTAGLSRLSDFGSLDTPTASVGTEQEDNNADGNLEDDGTELDSLDDGLHAFREPTLFRTAPGRVDQSHPALLPTHDGLGTFQASSQAVQDYLWQYEQYNPRSRGDVRHRRRSSVQRHLDIVNELDNVDMERERWQRIEKWRMEQSRAILQEIERETRRQRRNSRASLASNRVLNRRASTGALDSTSDTKAMSSNTSPPSGTASTQQGDPDTDESFWRRITRKVIRDLIGIDDSLLSVIFGESLPTVEEESSEQKQEDRSTADSEREASLNIDHELRDVEVAPGADTWKDRLLQRIARELGILVHQLCEHPGAFSTYLRASEDTLNEYAGIPLYRQTPHIPSKKHSQLPSTTPSDGSTNNLSSTMSPYFSPTLKDPTADHAALWGIEEEEIGLSTAANPNSTEFVLPAEDSTAEERLSESARLQQEREYWERELDVMMVFRYLRARFGRGGNSNSNTSTLRRTNSTIYTPQDPSNRAAIIRQHHPLVARAHARSQARQFQRQLHLHAQPNIGVYASCASSPVSHRPLRRQSSSCASLSTKVSGKRTLAGIGSGSSRNYWDIGESVGSGSVVSVGGAAGVGAWGDI